MYSLLPYNTFGIDVSAARFLEYTSVEELKKLIVQGAYDTFFGKLVVGSKRGLPKISYGFIFAFPHCRNRSAVKSSPH
jgi:hypothetical protein